MTNNHPSSSDDASSQASSSFPDFLRRISHEFSSLLSTTTTAVIERDEVDDDQAISRMFDPVDFNNPVEYSTQHTTMVRKNSSQTVLTEDDNAWFLRGYTFDDSSFVDDDDDCNIGLVSSSRGNPRVSSSRRTKGRHQQSCDRTTTCLAITCFLLTIVVGIMFAMVRPFQNDSTRNADNSLDQPTKDETDFRIPTLAPAELPTPQDTTIWKPPFVSTIEQDAAATSSPSTQSPSGDPSSAPTSSPTNPPTETPTAQPTHIPTTKPTNTPTKAPTTQLPTVFSNATSEEGLPLKIPPLSIGPMVGHTTHDSVLLWAYHEYLEDYTMEILLYDFETDGLLRQIDMVVPSKARNNALFERLTGLEPSKAYKFGMHIGGQRVGKGSFRTAPLPYQKSQFDYVLASCMNYRQDKHQMVWKEIAKNNNGGKYPDFAILAGDTVYLQEGVDVTPEGGVRFDRLWFRNKEQRNEAHFADFVRNTPIYSTWNDHEYGDNNASKDQKGKEKSLLAWESLWPNPGYGDAETDDGVYYSYYWGDVHYIVTDDHWYRDFSKGNRLGANQTEWIRNELIHSKGTFKVIVIGSDIMEREWTSDLENIGKIVRENRINGVLFHAGDIHRNEFKQMETGGFPYPVSQITSSGIAKVWRRPYVHIKVNTIESDPSITAHFYGASSMEDVTTWTNDANLTCSSIQGIDRAKEHSCTETIRLSDLTIP